MNFLLDVNASGVVAHWLRNLGHDVAEVGRMDPRMSDSDILSWALREPDYCDDRQRFRGNDLASGEGALWCIALGKSAALREDIALARCA